VETEVKCGASRLDLRLTDRRGRPVLVEVKNSTLAEGGTAYFPDAVTARGARHLDELAARSRAGERAALLIVVQRGDAERFSPADHIDPEWGRRLRAALHQGVEIWIYRAELTLKEVSLGPRLPLAL
jgi:sugar fermentation stimulation protein A